MTEQTFRFAYSTINWSSTPDMATMFQEIRDTGWHAVELFNHSLDWMGVPDILREQLGGLQVAISFGTVQPQMSQSDLHIQKQRIAYAAHFGAAAYGLVGGGRPRQHPPTSEDYKSLAAACEEMAEFADDYGMTIGYHPHTRCTIETETEIDILMNETQKTKLCLDASHIALVGEDPVKHVNKYIDRLSYMHLKDWAKGEFTELGEGTIGIDFPAIFNTLNALSFTGWVVVEHSVSQKSALVSTAFNANYLKQLGYSLEVTR